MGVQLDLILPPIIVGMLIIIIFRVNSFMMETSIDNRLNNDMQNFADVTAVVMEDQIRSLRNIVDFDSTKIRFIDAGFDTVTIQQSQRNLMISKHGLTTTTADTVVYPSSLSNLFFKMEPDTVATPTFIRFKVETESQPEHHAQMRKDVTTVKGFSERRVYLRNVALQVN